MSLIFRINGNKVDPPSNFKELEIELSFDNDNPSATLNVTSFNFDCGPRANNNHALLLDYLNSGSTDLE
jgi:hypothetical protein